MPTFMLIFRHSPENCPIHNEKVRTTLLEMLDKFDYLLKKHEIKFIGGWIVHSEHIGFEVYEAPSLEDFQKFNCEPEIAALDAYFTQEMKVVSNMKEAQKMLKNVNIIRKVRFYE